MVAHLRGKKAGPPSARDKEEEKEEDDEEELFADEDELPPLSDEDGEDEAVDDIALGADSSAGLAIASATAATTGGDDIMEEYFRLAHQRSEHISVQPRLLTGGHLKAYQVRDKRVGIFEVRDSAVVGDQQTTKVKRDLGPWCTPVK